MNNTPFKRREFVLGALTGIAAGVAAGVLWQKSSPAPPEPTGGSVFKTDKAARLTTLSYIAVDYAQCSGCGICCSPSANGRRGSRIQTKHFEPALAIASLCASCSDAPCVAVCPKEAGALTRDRTTGAIILDEAKCVGCQACINACAKDRAAVIRLSRNGAKALGICDLCGGDPACVKVCPEQCLSVVPANQDGRRFAAKPADIAESLSRNIFRSGRPQ